MHAPMPSESPHRASGSYKRSARADDSHRAGGDRLTGRDRSGRGRAPSVPNWRSNGRRPRAWVGTRPASEFKPLAVRGRWFQHGSHQGPRRRGRRATSGARYGGRRCLTSCALAGCLALIAVLVAF